MGSCVGNPSSELPPARPQKKARSSPASPSAGPGLEVPTIQQEQVIPKYRGRDISERYFLAPKPLGAGAFGTVSRAVHRTRGVVRAIKTVPHGGSKVMRALRAEIATMQAMDHPNVIKLYAAYEDKASSYLVMEICEGGELLDRILDATFFSERDAAFVMEQMLRAVHYIHSMDIVHRDLKLQNFLLSSPDRLENNTLKLIDFGFACNCPQGDVLRSCVGTPLYMAPEVLERRYDSQCDMWSVGVILYAMLSGHAPFQGKNEHEIFQKVKRGSFSLSGHIWQAVSSSAKDLICQLIAMNPQERITAERALQHTWIRREKPASQKVIEQHLARRLLTFRVRNKLERAVLKIVAHHLHEDKVRDLRAAFEALDANRDGVLTTEELREGLARAGFAEDCLDVHCMLAMADVNGNGKIDYSEFLAATLDRHHHLSDDALLAAFCIFDRDGSGRITEQELRRVLCSCSCATEDCCRPAILQLLSDVDLSGDGLIDFEEFKRMMQSWKEDACAGSTPASRPSLGGA